MKIVEAKCPGCGANVKFNEGDTKGVCEYCNKEFFIKKDPNEEFLLSMNEFSKDMMKNFSSSFKFSRIVFFVIFFMAFAMILGIMVFGFASTISHTGGLKDINTITSHDYSFIDTGAHRAIEKLSYGDEEFSLVDEPLRVKEFLAIKGKNNVYIPVYKAIYSNNSKENKYIVYIPVKFNNLKVDSFGIDTFNLGEGSIDAEDYYFNLEHSSSSKGYQSLEDVKTKYIDKNFKGYEIKEK